VEKWKGGRAEIGGMSLDKSDRKAWRSIRFQKTGLPKVGDKKFDY
jgi:hypothetical protein